MDVQDDNLSFRPALVDSTSEHFSYAIHAYIADSVTSHAVRHVVLDAYIVFMIYSAKTDVRSSIILGLSLVLVWRLFYTKDETFPLTSLYGAYMATQMALMTFRQRSALGSHPRCTLRRVFPCARELEAAGLLHDLGPFSQP
ncbi:hypothetical protein F4780DRAFT_742153 [Xylariomycetidae sp. FL0641]|nr:hypothetical protein F4780DRAFT_742153 [Xylariomycetidae sp. FL0641]